MSRGRVLVALSGGLDSAVAAARLVESSGGGGPEVVAVTLHLWDYPDDGSVRGRCCAPEDQYDARRVADFLAIPHFTFDRRALFREQVVAPFVDAYLEARTPSPCVTCNRTVKMRELFALGDQLGAETVATGHYARVRAAPGRLELLRGKDEQKDQSYFLHTLGPRELQRLRFPLGESTKAEVRAEASRRGLPVAGKGESQELCFVPTGRYDAFVDERAAGRIRPGPVVHEDGRVLGEHAGLHRFTVGQRRGLRVALGAPAYVVGIDPETAQVRVGPEASLFATMAWMVDASFADDVRFPLEASVRVRSRHEGERARLELLEPGVFAIRFAAPVRALTSGQVGVAYDGDRVLGGGVLVTEEPRGAR